jgi:hypothetical protein
MIRLCLHAYCHVVGVDANKNVPLLSNLPPPETDPATINHPISMLRVNSKFDYEGNVCKVVSVNPDGTVLTLSVWGPRTGEEIMLNTTKEVVNLVSAKGG